MTGEAIEAYICRMGLYAAGLSVDVDGAQGLAKVYGTAPDQATRERILLCCGNVEGVEKVEDHMSLSTPAAASQWHTVAKGDTLSAIALKFYANPGLYSTISRQTSRCCRTPTASTLGRCCAFRPRHRRGEWPGPCPLPSPASVHLADFSSQTGLPAFQYDINPAL
jgi:hypothetical protein